MSLDEGLRRSAGSNGRGRLHTGAGANGTSRDGKPEPIEVSVLMPCLNEEESVGDCVEQAQKANVQLGVEGEVIVIDNGSTDRTAQVAREAGARVLFAPQRGYGNAYRLGLSEARGQYLVMGDADGTYDFDDIGAFIEPLRDGADMVMGSRVRGAIEPGAMPWLHRYVGTPFFAGLARLCFGTGVSDIHCGMRSLTRSAYQRIHLSSSGMELASELVIVAYLAGLKIEEIPITYRRRAGGETKLRTWADGWRHLRLILATASRAQSPPRRRPESVNGESHPLHAEHEPSL